MFNLQAQAAGGYGKNSSIYGREWEAMLDGDDLPLVYNEQDSLECIRQLREFDREDGLGQHTNYRMVAVS